MSRLGAYGSLGSTLVLGGTVFTLFAWLVISSIPLMALGISAVLVGIVALALSRSLPELPPEASVAVLQTGLENLSALVEELGLSSGALYLPSHLAGGTPHALIPLHENSAHPQIRRALPARLIASYGPAPEDVGLLVRTVGTTVLQLAQAPPGDSSAELESALKAALVGQFDLADAVLVYRDEHRVVVEISRPRLRERDLWICRSLGSPLASIVASFVAEGLDQSVMVYSEEWFPGKLRIVLEPVDAAV
jgi:hypothetical protein